MRPLILGIALSLAAATASAQRVERVAMDNSASARAPLLVASTSLRIAPADASSPYTPPAPYYIGADGGRVVSILIGALIGGGIVFGAMTSVDCKDCKGSSRTVGAAGGAVGGGFIGSAVWGYRPRKATIPPPPPK